MTSTRRKSRAFPYQPSRPRPWRSPWIGATTWLGVAVAFCVMHGAGVCGEAPESKARPNFVIILADDMGYGDSSVYGGWIKTPQLERLAARGMKFTDFHSSGNVCSPTRAGLLTGRYQQRVGVPGVINADPKVPAHFDGLDPKEPTFASLLHHAGYATAIFGKWHLGYDRKFNPLHHRFDEFRGYVSGNIDYQSHYDRMGVYDWWNGLEKTEEPGYSTQLITRHAIRFIEEHRQAPFCVYVAHEAVHSPYQGPNDPPQRGPRAKPGKKADIKRAYREMMVEMDRGIGQILDTLDRLQLAHNTFVFFFSDNGANRNGSNGVLHGFKGSNWEGGHRVPAIASWPGRIAEGKTTDALTISLDVMPTMLELAGVDLPAGHRLDGKSLAGVLLRGEQPESARKLYWNGKAMREGSWKLMMVGKGKQESAQLFRLDRDLGEKHDVAGEFPGQLERMMADLSEWRSEVGQAEQ